jgi:hypothetical protein
LNSIAAQGADMSIAAYFQCDFFAGAATAVARGDQIETDVSRYRDVIPFWDGDPIQDGVILRSDPATNHVAAKLPAAGKI